MARADRAKQRFVPIRPLAGSRARGPASSVKKLGQALSDAKYPGLIHLRLIGKGQPLHQTLEVGGGARRIRNSSGTAPAEVHVITTVGTWTMIATGKLSPLEAFLRGQLRIGGDMELAKQIYRHLAASSQGIAELC